MNLNDGDINQIEQCVREEGLKYAESKLKNNNQIEADSLLYENQLVVYFGETYAPTPSNFRFEIGDKKLIKIVRDHIIKQQNEKGVKCADSERNPTAKLKQKLKLTSANQKTH